MGTRPMKPVQMQFAPPLSELEKHALQCSVYIRSKYHVVQRGFQGAVEGISQLCLQSFCSAALSWPGDSLCLQ